MELAQLNPYILFMDQRICLYSYDTSIVAYDWRLFFMRSGEARVIIENETLNLKKGDCLVFRGGLVYRFFFNEEQPADMYVVNFDLDCGCFGAKSRHPVTPEEFHFENLCRETVSEMPDRVMLVYLPEIESSLARLLNEHQSREMGHREMCSAYLKSILIQVVRSSSGGRCDDVLVRSIMAYLDDHFRERISGEELSERFNYHSYYLGKRFKAQTGMSIHRYVLLLRVRKCAFLLLNSSLNVAEIADECGFSSPSYLSEYFKKVYRMTPGEYREKGKLL